ncbi:MAG: hypothetical protein ACFFC7_14965 [Candidatus Hermodarchaeota archaeon]
MKKLILGVSIILLMIFGSLTGISFASNSSSDNSKSSKPWPQGSYIHWDEIERNENINWEHSVAVYEFGPEPSVETYQNGPVEAVEREQAVSFNLTIPKNLWPSGSGQSLGGFELWVHLYSHRAHAVFFLKYYENGTYDLWQVMWQDIRPKTTVKYSDFQKELASINPLAGMTPKTFTYRKAENEFFLLTEIATDSDTTNDYRTVIGQFGASAPTGTYIVAVNIFDDDDKQIHSKWRGMESKTTDFFIIGSGTGYILEMLNSTDIPKHIFKPNEEVTIRINSTEEMSHVLLVLPFMPTDGAEGVGFLYLIYNDLTGLTVAGGRVHNDVFYFDQNATAPTVFIDSAYSTSKVGDWYSLEISGKFTPDWIRPGTTKLEADLGIYEIFNTHGNWILPYLGDWENALWKFILADEFIFIETLDEDGNPIKNPEKWWEPVVFEPNQDITLNVHYIGENLADYASVNVTFVKIELVDEMYGVYDVAQVNIGYKRTPVDQMSMEIIHVLYNSTSDTYEPLPVDWISVTDFDYQEGSSESLYTFNITFDGAPVGTYFAKFGMIGTPDSLVESGAFIIGDVEFWEYRKWAINVDTGALDLDGDLGTPDDQYYVLREEEDANTWDISAHYGGVGLQWDPSTFIGDELRMSSIAGVFNLKWTFEWNITFTWYHSDDMTPVSNAEFAVINETIWGPDDMSDQFHTDWDEPAQGYHELAWLTINHSSSDPKYDDQWWTDGVEVSWFWFEMQDHYFTGETETSLEAVAMYVGLHGMVLYNDTDGNGIVTVSQTDMGLESDEVTHIIMLKDGTMAFTPPTINGVAVPKAETTGFNPDAELEWALGLTDIDGILFPVKINGRFYGYWDWVAGKIESFDYDDFNSAPTEFQCDEVLWTFHAQGHVAGTKADVNSFTVKIDQFIDDFYGFSRNGIPLSQYAIETGLWNETKYEETDVYTGLSLAIGYNTAIFTANIRFTDKNSEFTNPEQATNSTESDEFAFKMGTKDLAVIQMGGSTYEWGYDGSTKTAYSAITPPRMFEAFFAHENEGTHTAMSVNGTRYFMTSCFKEWGGYSIDNDPTFSAITGSGYEDTSTTTLPTTSTAAPGLLAVITLFAITTFAAIYIRRKRK